VSVESLFSFIQKKRESRTSCDREEEEEEEARQYPTRKRERITREKKKKKKCTRARLGLTRFTSFDNQIIKSDGTDKCASSLALRARESSFSLFSSPFSLSFQSTRRKRKMSNEDRATTGANKSSQQKRLEAYRSCPSRRRLALSKPRV
jgi:hypothetical protein